MRFATRLISESIFTLTIKKPRGFLGLTIPEITHEHWQSIGHPSHWRRAVDELLSHRASLWRQFGCAHLSCAEQFRAMAVEQLTWRESLHDIELNLSANSTKLYAMGFLRTVKRSALADANQSRDWCI